MEAVDTKKMDKQAREDFFWLTKIVKDNEQGMAFENRIEIKNNRAYATDGKRLHALDLTGKYDLKPGIYDVVKKTKSQTILILCEEALTFPDCESVFPSGEYTTVQSDSPYVLSARMIRVMGEEGTFNTDFIKDIVGEDSRAWEVSVYGNKKPALFANFSGNRKALLMPMSEI